MDRNPDQKRPSIFTTPDWELETPTTVDDLLQQNPIGPLFMLFLMWALGIGLLSAENTLHLRSLIAVPLGTLIGTGAWWLLMIGYAKGLITDE